MKPKLGTPQYAAYVAGERAHGEGKLLKENPISQRNRMSALRAWWDTGWREAERALIQAAELMEKRR